MNYEKPEVKIQKFSADAFLGDDLLSALEHEGLGGGDNPDDTNLGDIGYEILNNIFNNNP